eukprot:NODE_16978_length_967_cov_10.564286.p2 GENE.NODE_16978_length_967_cov_10.564286~~NODE_16978_length_967_cov_10.564286.p2  ORF type:complete len:161 (+),score=60.24 NODE_16978_length_967_cov_10.564286:94-576(+)
MWSPNPGPCVAAVAEWGQNVDDLEYEKALLSMPKKVLKRREMVVKNTDCKKILQKMERVRFSVACWPLSEFSAESGRGDDQASLIHVYYERNAERKVLNAFSSCGIDLESAEAVSVDPESSIRHEQDIMFHQEGLFLTDNHMHELTPIRTLDEIKRAFNM